MLLTGVFYFSRAWGKVAKGAVMWIVILFCFKSRKRITKLNLLEQKLQNRYKKNLKS